MKSTRILWVVTTLLLVSLFTGCAAINSGPKMMQTTAEGATAIGKVLIQKLDPNEMMAESGGAISDPRFKVRIFAGTGFYYDMEFSLTGADLNFDIQAAGTGLHDVPPEITLELQKVWGNSALSEQARRDKIVEILTAYLTSKIPPTTTPPATD